MRVGCMMKWLLLLLAIMLLLVSNVSADYVLQLQALTNSPADSATNYIGNRPSAPTTTVGISTITIPTDGNITIAQIYDYSGTAGTAEAYSYYVRVNGIDHLISTLSVSANERVFSNTSMEIPVSEGDTFEIKRVHPAWATNPLTNTVGGYIVVNTSWSSPGYTVYGMALTNTPADSVTNYLGGRPIAPSTATGTNKIYLPLSGTISRTSVDDYSDTAGSAEAYTYNIVKNGGAPNLVNTLSVSVNRRLFENTAMDVPVSGGDYVEFQRIHPLWTTNPATNIVGATAFINRDEEPVVDGYPIWIEALTSSPVDAQTVYFGNNPLAPTTTTNISKVYIQQDGVITRSEIYVYSETAGTNQNWSLYVRVNGVQDYLISTVGVATNERIFRNTSQGIPVSAGDYIEIKSVQPTWTTNPLTTIYGGYVFLEYTNDKPLPAFTGNVTHGIPPLPVQFTDSSETAITDWDWTATNLLNATTIHFSTVKNPEQTFDTGNWQINLATTNASGTRSTTKTHVIYVNPSGGYTGFTPADIVMSPSYTLTVHITDTDGNIIPVSTVTLDDGQSFTTTNGTAIFTVDSGAIAVYITSTGYYSTSRSYNMDDNREVTIQLTKATETVQNTNTIWSPRDVAIQVLDSEYNPIQNNPVYINAYSSSLPGGLTGAMQYFMDTYGAREDTAWMMLNESTTYTSTTDNYGFISSQVVNIIQYKIITPDVNGVNTTTLMWPTGSYFQIVTGNATNPGIAAQMRGQNLNYTMSDFNTTYWQPNASYSCMGVKVYDHTGGTSNVYAWWKLVDNGTVWWLNSTAIGGYGPINSTKCVPHVPYQQWKWGGITD